MHFVSRLVLAASVFGTVPALADPAAGTPAGTPAAEKPADPMICERVQEIGSLLRKKKICMLKSQWEEQRRDNRSSIERTQVQRGISTAG